METKNYDPLSAGNRRRTLVRLALMHSGQGQVEVTARLVTVLSGMATGSCIPVTVRRKMPPSADCRVSQTVPPGRVTFRWAGGLAGTAGAQANGRR